MKHLLFSAAIIAVLASPAYGQTQTDDEIISVGSRIEFLTKDDLTSPLSVIDADDIALKGQAYIADLLRSVPGVAVNRSGPAGSLTQIRLRGSEANHVLVLIDGVEASNPNTGEFDFAALRAEDVVRIEILRGEQSALWGSDAIGGVINIITRAGADIPAYRLSVEAGSFQTLEGQISGVIPVYGGASLSLNGNAFTSEGYDVSGLNGEKDGSNSRSLNIGLNHVTVAQVDLSAKYSASTAYNEFDSDTDFNGRLDNTLAETKTENQNAHVAAAFKLAGFDHLITASLTDTDQTTTGTSFTNDTTGRREQLNWAAKGTWDAHSLTLLAETEKERFSNFGGIGAGQNQNRSIRNHAVAADYRYLQNALTLSASVRADFNDRFDDSVTWRVGVGYAFDEIGGRIRGSVGTGVKNPSMTELFGFFPAFFVGNPNLKPEKSIGYDIGYEQKFGQFKFAIDYFHSDLEDEIYTDFAAFPSTAKNRTTKSKREGVEIEASGKLSDQFTLRGSATFLNAKENGIKEIRRPDFLASASATWQPTDALGMTLSIDHTGSQIDTDFATFSKVELDAFTLVGLNVRYKLNDIVTLSVRGDNLLDETYQEVVGYASQGRGIYAGFSANF